MYKLSIEWPNLSGSGKIYVIVIAVLCHGMKLETTSVLLFLYCIYLPSYNNTDFKNDQ